jgi:hypothetical protein
MKHLKPDFVLLGIILVFSGCIHVANVPQIPTLIVPEDGAVFEAEPPTFIWTSDSLFLADAYVIMIFKDSLRSEDTLVYETLEDTTYTMPTEVFDSADSGTYCWVAAVHWIDGNVETTAHGDPRTFVIKKSESPAGLDLDTTYFPFGLGYEWVFYRDEWGYDEISEPPYDYEASYTFTISVIDAFRIGGTFFFVLETEPTRYYYPPTFMEFDTVRISGNQIKIKWGGGVMIGLLPSEMTEPFVISYASDTLCMSDGYFGGHWGTDVSIKRIVGIGTTSQSHSYWYSGSSGLGAADYVSDTLLYFYNGRDTVYKAD